MKKSLRSITDLLKVDDWLGLLINKHFEKDAPEYWAEPNLYIHPSSSSSSCERFIELGMLGHRIKSGSSIRRLANGVDTHSRWNTYFEEMGILVAANYKKKYTDVSFYIGNILFDKFNWSGEVDVILTNKNKLYIGEIKSMSSERWDRIPDQTISFEEMSFKLGQIEKRYVYQLCQYYTILSRLDSDYTFDPSCFFLFENTNTQEVKIRWVSFSENFQLETLDKPYKALYNAQRGTLVDPPFDMNSSICKSCGRKDICFALQYGSEKEKRIVESRLNGN